MGSGWLLTALLWASAAIAQGAPPGPTTWPAFPLEAVAPGLRGYGLTEGPSGVERFDVEVLALQEGFGLAFPLVLVRASGGLVDVGGGVAAGMSGSPVVLTDGPEERVLGAIGYVFPDSAGGLALVTPIGAMRSERRGRRRRRGALGSRGGAGGDPAARRRGSVRGPWRSCRRAS